MAIDLNTKPWYVAAIIGVLLGAALFAVMHMYVFKEIGSQIERLEKFDRRSRAGDRKGARSQGGSAAA